MLTGLIIYLSLEVKSLRIQYDANNVFGGWNRFIIVKAQKRQQKSGQYFIARFFE